MMDNRNYIASLFQSDRRPPADGVLGLVDELLACCRDRQIRLSWQPEPVTFEPVGGGRSESVPSGLRRSVLRAAIARIAALCNRNRSELIDPCTGGGEFEDEASPANAFRAEYANTPDDQRLELKPLSPRIAPGILPSYRSAETAIVEFAS